MTANKALDLALLQHPEQILVNHWRVDKPPTNPLSSTMEGTQQ